MPRGLADRVNCRDAGGLEHGIAPDVQLIPIQKLNQAYKWFKLGDVRFRYVIDMASLKQEIAEA